MIKSNQRQFCDILRSNFTSKLNYNQSRTSIYNKYKHGPNRLSNPEPTTEDYKRWAKEAFSRKGWEAWKEALNRVYHFRVERVFRVHYDTAKTYVFEHFDSDKFLENWKVGADSDFFNGYSHGELIRSPAGHALFRGVLDNRLPDDGLTENSGFVAMIGPSAPMKKLFQFQTRFDWREFNTFEIRFRGDGRTYQLVVNTASYTSDIHYYDCYSYPLYTRGGPYWQTLRIPFSKFIFTVKNHPQDEQSSLPVSNVKFVAINIQDKNDGPFALEIDYMGLRRDWFAVQEDHPYEQYQFAHIKYKQISIGCDPPEN